MTPEQSQELLDRMRRLETRLTKWLYQQGFDTETQRPEWLNGTVLVPSAHSSMKEILQVVPVDWDRTKPVKVMHHEKFLAVLLLP